MISALICLALNVYHEARNQPVSDQVATAQAVLERVESHEYPGTVCAVVEQKLSGGGCHFTWKCASIPKYDPRAWKNAQLIASAALAGSGHADFNAVNYHADYVSPNWPRRIYVGRYGGRHLYYMVGG